MKSKITLLLVLLFAVAVNTQAQPGQGGRRTPEERAKMMAQRLTDSLKLSTDQQTKIEAVYVESNKASDKLREGLAPGTRPEKADMDKINNARDEKLKIILTEAQYKRLKDELEPAMRRPRPSGN